MKIIISGYGRMGRLIEKIALERKHKIIAILDSPNDFKQYKYVFSEADVAIDFSIPEVVTNNILHFFDANIPIVVGTTGWYHRLDEIKTRCLQQNQSLLYGTNMSIGVNLLFELNRYLAKLLHPYHAYKPSIEETHHIHKKDAPSGTAITLANDILEQYSELKGWTLNCQEEKNKLSISAFREGEVIGNHAIKYTSVIDEITISHQAFNREGFALGAVMAAEWLPGHYGVFTISDIIAQAFP